MANSGVSTPPPNRGVPAWRRNLQSIVNWVVLGLFVVGMFFFLRSRAHQQVVPLLESEVPAARISVAASDTLEIAPETIRAMHIEHVAVLAAPSNVPLKLYGSLYLEGSRLVHVQTRFTGQVVEVGEISEGDKEPGRPIKPGDQVAKGQVLAKLWSKEVGEKKSDLVDAISKFYLHENVLKRLQTLKEGVVPVARLQEAERDFAADKIEIERLKRTLRSWQIQEDELKAIEAEAQRIIEESLLKDRQQSQARLATPPLKPSEQLALDRTWAELDIVAPMAGVILEKNFTVGDIVDTTHDMFKIADLSRLGVMANVYEEDLPKLVAIRPEDRNWQIELLAEPGVTPRRGQFESVGNVLDPMQHTAIVKGWLDNPDGQLRVGQFVTATVDLPNRPGLVIVPITSLVDEGSHTFVFVAQEPERTSFTKREVFVVRRGAVMAQLQIDPPAGLIVDTKNPPLQIGQRVVSSGAIELAAQFNVLQTQRTDVAVETSDSHEAGKAP